MTVDLALAGCRSDSLGSYLKALAVLRLVGEQKTEAARGYWKDGAFHLVSNLTQDALLDFFAEEYVPTPIVGPWGARSGFFNGSSESSARKALQTIEASDNRRLTPFRETIAATKACLKTMGLDEKPEKGRKTELLVALRNSLPDAALPWLDAAYVLGSRPGARGFPIILGTGGNEGSQGFASTFMAALEKVGILSNMVDPSTIGAALLGMTGHNVSSAASGQFAPGMTPGLNQGPGFVGGPSPSAWEMLLVFEGTATWLSGATKREGASGPSRFSSPFTVRARTVGFNAADGDEEQARGEIWLPTWFRPSSWSEVAALILEGRAQYGGRSAGTALDMVKAVGTLGVSRGIDAFERHVILQRNGKSYFAVSVGRFEAFERDHADLLRQLDAPLNQIDRAIRALKERAPGRLVAARRAVEEALFDAYREPTPDLLRLLRSVGQLERLVAKMDGGRSLLRRPLRGLSIDWLSAVPDSLELRVAAAIASIQTIGDVGPLRANLIPIKPARPDMFAKGDGQTAWYGSSLARRLAAVLERRLIDFERLTCRTIPLRGRIEISAEDICAFIEGRCDDRIVEELLFALTWVDWRPSRPDERPDHSTMRSLPNWEMAVSPSPVFTEYALLRSVIDPAPGRQASSASDSRYTFEPGVVPLVVAGQMDRAIRRAVTRLRVLGMNPINLHRSASRELLLIDPAVNPVRLAAGLLIPVRKPNDLRDLVCRA